MSKRIITLITDYGTVDSYVGQLKGVIKSLAAEAEILDISHEISPGAISQGARVVKEAARCFPENSRDFTIVHLAVVDPTVGSARRRIIVKTRRAYFIGPDNGLLSLAAPKPERLEVWEIKPDVNCQISGVSPASTFDGRNFFAPAAALISRGDDLNAFATRASQLEIVELQLPEISRRNDAEIVGEVISFDRFGNAATNIGAEHLRPGVEVSLARLGLTLRAVTSFSELPSGQAGYIINSQGELEVVLNQDSSRELLEIKLGDKVKLEVK